MSKIDDLSVTYKVNEYEIKSVSSFVSNNRNFTIIEYTDGDWEYEIQGNPVVYSENSFGSKEEAISDIESIIYIDDIPEDFTVGSEWWVPVKLNGRPIITRAEICDIDKVLCGKYLGLAVVYKVTEEDDFMFYNINETYILKLDDFFKSNPEDFIVP